MIKILFFCTSLLVLADIVRCRPDYTFNHLVNGWLKLHRIPATWQEAFLRCHYEGAVLVSPLNDELTRHLQAIITESESVGISKIFLGTHALHSGEDFFSVEGVPLADMPIKWDKSSLGADGVGNCLTMRIDGRDHYMAVSSCSERLPYICYKKLGTDMSLLDFSKTPCGTSDKKYILNHQTGSCYKLHQEHHDWWRAHMICAAEGGYLVILNNEEEASIVKKMFPGHGNMPTNIWEPMHIGLRAWDDVRAWVSIHGESLENLYNVWSPNQPDNHRNKQHCGVLLRNGTLDDQSCDSAAIFVCEKDPKTSRYESVTAHGFEQ